MQAPLAVSERHVPDQGECPYEVSHRVEVCATGGDDTHLLELMTRTGWFLSVYGTTQPITADNLDAVSQNNSSWLDLT